MPDRLPTAVGRAAGAAPPNRFESIHVEADLEQLAGDDELLASERRVKTQFLVDASQSIITSNDSPDVFFKYSINPYRGCEHGCVYCYARPGHEYLGFDAGLDFESRIMVKQRAPQLLRDELAKPGWTGEFLMISGVTDCYQPAERHFRLTRGCLEVLHEAKQVCGIITKNALVTRDLDLLAPMAAMRTVGVSLSITTLDAELARTLEPRTSPPEKKLAAIRRLAAAGVPTRVMVAPIIPGLTDHEVPKILEAAAEAGAVGAGYVLLRLPLAVEPIFLDWLARNYPDKAERVESLVRGTRSGRMYQAEWGKRMRGTGRYAEQIEQSFQVFRKKFGLDRPEVDYDHTLFRPPRSSQGQGMLF
jgi:DNA repair photolyase